MNSILYIISLLLIFPIGCNQVNPTPSTSPSTTIINSATPEITSSSSIQQTNNNELNNIMYIKTGTYFGQCAGYCQEEFTITQNKIIYLSKSGGRGGNNFPDITKERTISIDDYNNLSKLIDIKKFKSLPERIGCPDCDDGGGEWLEIKDDNSTKRIDFVYSKSVPEIKDLLEKLRAIRKESKNPDFINKMIAEFKIQPVKNPPVIINQYDYKSKRVYYIPPSCCDIPSELYSEQNVIICSPDGGMTGNGDGKCNDFFSERKNEVLIWKDDRK